jgi:low affinity Fe/Cu permease
MLGNGRKNGGAQTSMMVDAAATVRPLNKLFSNIAKAISRGVGRAWVFVVAVSCIIAWAITGPFFGFSDTWQLVINTGTTIVTFLMVFLIQNAQNRDAAAIQAKLDELIRTSRARNSFVGVEQLTEDDLELIRKQCELRAKGETGGQGRSAPRRKTNVQITEVKSGGK